MGNCIKCGTVIPRYDSAGRKISQKAYDKKKYCCRPCADKYRKEHSVGWYGVVWKESTS